MSSNLVLTRSCYLCVQVQVALSLPSRPLEQPPAIKGGRPRHQHFQASNLQCRLLPALMSSLDLLTSPSTCPFCAAAFCSCLFKARCDSSRIPTTADAVHTGLAESTTRHPEEPLLHGTRELAQLEVMSDLAQPHRGYLRACPVHHLRRVHYARLQLQLRI